MAGRRSLALIALLGCVLAGCSDAASDDPAPMPTESPTSGERDVISSVPTLPPAARKDTLKGAETFIRHYVELLNYASDTGDVSHLAAASRGCSGCKKYEQLFRRTYASGGFMKSNGWTPTHLLAIKLKATTAVMADVRAGRMRYRLSASDDIRIGKSDEFKLKFELSRIDGEWVVTHFGTQNIDSAS